MPVVNSVMCISGEQCDVCQWWEIDVLTCQTELVSESDQHWLPWQSSPPLTSIHFLFSNILVYRLERMGVVMGVAVCVLERSVLTWPPLWPSLA